MIGSWRASNGQREPWGRSAGWAGAWGITAASGGEAVAGRQRAPRPSPACRRSGLQPAIEAASPAVVATFAYALAYGGGLWLLAIHIWEGGTELNEPPPVIHWLRDSSLLLPLVMLAVWTATRLAVRLGVRAELPDGQALTPPPAGGPPGSQRERERGRGASATLAHTLRLARRGAARRTTRASSAAQVVLIAYFASLAMAAGSPLHSSFFEAHHGGPDLPFWLHLIRDGLLALAANVPITVLLLAAMTRFRRGGLRRSLRPASRHAL